MASRAFFAAILATFAPLALLATGCGESPPAKGTSGDPFAALANIGKGKKPAVLARSVAQPTVKEGTTNGVAPAAPAVTLRSPMALAHFFEGLRGLEEGLSTNDVRIAQFGDSHTAADLETGEIRRELQERFGDGGRGFVPLGMPYAGYYQESVKVGMAGWKSERGKYVKGKFVGDGVYGLSGISVESDKGGARAWTDVTAPTSHIELAMLAQPGGGSLDVSVDGTRIRRVKTLSPDYGSTFEAFDVPEGPHHIEARSVGDGDVRMFGMALDRQTPGVTLDALGINGARVTTDLNWNEPSFIDQLQHRDPALVVLAFGTNEAGDDTPAATYQQQITDLLSRVKRAVPNASCLLLGPGDRAAKDPAMPGSWLTMPKLLDVIDSQERVAAANGCAFYDQLTAMGGPGSVTAWADEDPPRAQRDHVHLTVAGYRQLGGAFAQDVLRAYDAWRAQTPDAPTGPGQPLNPANQQPNRPLDPLPRPDSVARLNSASPSIQPYGR